MCARIEGDLDRISGSSAIPGFEIEWVENNIMNKCLKVQNHSKVHLL